MCLDVFIEDVALKNQRAFVFARLVDRGSCVANDLANIGTLNSEIYDSFKNALTYAANV